MAAAPAPTLADAHRLVAEVACDDPRVGRVLLFGSVARGEARLGSDLDLVVVLAADFDGNAQQAFADDIDETTIAVGK